MDRVLPPSTEPLDYQKSAPSPWWKNRWIWRSVIVLALSSTCWKILAWADIAAERYKCYQLEHQAASWPNKADQQIVTYAAPAGMVIHSLPATSSFDKVLWLARSAEPWRVSGVTGTLLFCHQLTTSAGTSRIVQVYGSIVPASAGSPARLKWIAVTIPPVDLNWVMRGYDLNQSIQAAPDIASAELLLKSSRPLSVDSGSVDTTDRAAALFSYTLQDHRWAFRLHLIDYASDGYTTPKLAFETVDEPWRLPGWSNWFLGFSRSGFFEWPIAAPTPKK